MTRKMFVIYFGLVVLAMSLFASSASAGNSPAPTQVVVTNGPAQPVPIAGLIKDSDAPARKSFQSVFIRVNSNERGSVVSVPAGQRFVAEHVSGQCVGGSGQIDNYVNIFAEDPSTNYTVGQEFLPGGMLNGTVSEPIRFYADPGMNVILWFADFGGSGGHCEVSVSGYFVNLV